MGIREVACVMGVSERTVKRWIAAGRLPAIRLGYKIVRIRPEELLRFVGL